VAVGIDNFRRHSDERFQGSPLGVAAFHQNRHRVLNMRHDLDPTQYAEADRREVDPPIEVESATWSPGGTLDWWVKERQEWWGRVRGPDGRQRWVKAVDLRRVESE
jgi:hypothetical protein